MTLQLLIAGGGIGGLAAAFACARSAHGVQLFERSAAFSEAGAGIQLGPNVTRILEAWSLGPALRECAAAPSALRVRDANDGRELAGMALGADIERRYGAPYLTVHRADLQQLLLAAARGAGAHLQLASEVTGVDESTQAVAATLADARSIAGDALIVADGVWTRLRQRVTADGAARATGHFAYRALAPQASLAERLRSGDVTVWLAPRMHVVTYPVRGGDALNVVALVELPQRAAVQGWDDAGARADLQPLIATMCTPLRALVEAMPAWGVWALHDRRPVRGAHELARGRVALLGDAAHPMLPYLAQGAGMAIEDADALARVLEGSDAGRVAAALERYAAARWRRSAMVQQRARRNAAIFHASGPLRMARDTAMRIAGAKLLDQPWLYGR